MVNKFLFTVLCLGYAVSGFCAPPAERAPVQVYEGASQGSSTQNTSTVQEILATEKNIEQLVDNESTEDSPLSSLQHNDASATQTKEDLPKEKQAPSEIENLNNTEMLYRQTVDGRLESLSEQVHDLQARIKNLMEAMSLLNTEFTKLNQQPSSPSQWPAKTKIQRSVWEDEYAALLARLKAIKAELGSFGFYLLIALAVILIFIFIVALYPKKNRKPQRLSSKISVPLAGKEEGASDEDYDYLSSADSIPARLNLARAYIAMEDYSAAKKIIAEIIVKGNGAQTEEAHSLLEKIIAESA